MMPLHIESPRKLAKNLFKARIWRAVRDLGGKHLEDGDSLMILSSLNLLSEESESIIEEMIDEGWLTGDNNCLNLLNDEEHVLLARYLDDWDEFIFQISVEKGVVYPNGSGTVSISDFITSTEKFWKGKVLFDVTPDAAMEIAIEEAVLEIYGNWNPYYGEMNPHGEFQKEKYVKKVREIFSKHGDKLRYPFIPDMDTSRQSLMEVDEVYYKCYHCERVLNEDSYAYTKELHALWDGKCWRCGNELLTSDEKGKTIDRKISNLFDTDVLIGTDLEKIGVLLEQPAGEIMMEVASPRDLAMEILKTRLALVIYESVKDGIPLIVGILRKTGWYAAPTIALLKEMKEEKWKLEDHVQLARYFRDEPGLIVIQKISGVVPSIIQFWTRGNKSLPFEVTTDVALEIAVEQIATEMSMIWDPGIDGEDEEATIIEFPIDVFVERIGDIFLKHGDKPYRSIVPDLDRSSFQELQDSISTCGNCFLHPIYDDATREIWNGKCWKCGKDLNTMPPGNVYLTDLVIAIKEGRLMEIWMNNMKKMDGG